MEPLNISRNVSERTIRHVRPAKIQINLCIRAVFWIANYARLHHANNENSDQIVQMREGTFSDVAAHLLCGDIRLHMTYLMGRTA